MSDGALEVILSRRSIRKYTDRAIEEGSLEQLLRAAMSAPSAHDQRPWEFVIIDDRETLRASRCSPYSGCTSPMPMALRPYHRAPDAGLLAPGLRRGDDEHPDGGQGPGDRIGVARRLPHRIPGRGSELTAGPPGGDHALFNSIPGVPRRGKGTLRAIRSSQGSQEPVAGIKGGWPFLGVGPPGQAGLFF